MNCAISRPLELLRALARLSSEAFLIDAKLSERSRQAERVFSVKPFLVLFWAPKSTEEKSPGKQCLWGQATDRVKRKVLSGKIRYLSKKHA
jgi:hypothetical protein